MAQFKQAVITEKGLHLNTKIQAGLCNAHFTKAAIGSGIWESADDLSTATSLISQRMEEAFQDIAVVDKDKVLLTSAFPNSSVQTRFNVTELGIFAADPDEGEILYSISICDEADADLMPTQYGGSVTFIYKNYITIWNAAEVTINTSGAFALADDVGNKDDLITIDKETLVRAINELAGKVAWIENNALFTSIYTSVVYDEGTENLALANACSYEGESLMIPTSLGEYIADIENLRFHDADELLSMIHGYVLPNATESVLGGLKVGTGLVYDDAGVVSVDPQLMEDGVGNAILAGEADYDTDSEDLSFSGALPVATTERLGAVRIGDGLSVQVDGTVSVNDATVLDEDTVATDTQSNEMLDDVFNGVNDEEEGE